MTLLTLRKKKDFNPEHDSIIGLCNDCRAEVWITKGKSEEIYQTSGALCYECVHKIEDSDIQFAFTAEQIKECVKMTGRTEEEFRDFAKRNSIEIIEDVIQ